MSKKNINKNVWVGLVCLKPKSFSRTDKKKKKKNYFQHVPMYKL